MWGLARAYQDIDKRKSIEIFNKILTSLETLSGDHQFNKIVLKHKIAMLYTEIEDYENALILCNEILDFNLKSDEIRKKLNDRIKRTEELRELLLDRAQK